MNQYLVFVYGAYALLSFTLTVYLARTLAKNGAVFLRTVFKDEPDLAAAVNKLLVVGFYVSNLGYAALIMQANPATTVTGAIETLANRLGQLLVSLGVMHFFNMYLFYRIRRRGQLAVLPPPVAPQHWQQAPQPVMQPSQSQMGWHEREAARVHAGAR